MLHIIPAVSEEKGDSNPKDFLEVVLSYCGTISLSKAINLLTICNNLKTCDVFVKAGSPGHAIIVVDVASGSSGKKIFMLAQGFMPAQSIHIVKKSLMRR